MVNREAEMAADPIGKSRKVRQWGNIITGIGKFIPMPVTSLTWKGLSAAGYAVYSAMDAALHRAGEVAQNVAGDVTLDDAGEVAVDRAVHMLRQYAEKFGGFLRAFQIKVVLADDAFGVSRL